MLLYSTDCLKRNSKMKNKEQHTFPFIERLLDGAEVEWKPLGEVLKRTKGTKITAKQMKTMHKSGAPVKIFAGGKTFAFVDFEDIPEKDINRNPSVIVKSRGIIEFEYYDKPFTHKNEMWSYYSDNKSINIKYVYYYLKHQEAFFQRLGSKMQMPQISLPDTERFKIPIPPLAVQEEIVDILDKFTELEAELEAELEGRKRQYEYYRNQLLSFDMLNKGGVRLNNVTNNQFFHDNKIVEWLPIGSITKYEQPTNYLVKSTNYHESYATPVLTAGKTFILGYTNEENGIYKASKTPVIIFDDFTTANKWVNFDFKAKSSAMKMITSKDESKVLLRYIYYWLNTLPTEIAEGDHKRQWISSFCSKKIPIPCPSKPEKSLEIQRKIVSILDKFDTLTTSISEGLPKEIELRKKQYEFYRDRLLSFAQH